MDDAMVRVSEAESQAALLHDTLQTEKASVQSCTQAEEELKV